MMPIENIQQFRSVCAWNVLSAHSLHVGLPSGPYQGTFGRTRGLQSQRLFSPIQDFWQSSEAAGLSQVSKMLRQLTGQIPAHYPSSKIRNTNLRLFRPDHGPHTVSRIFSI